MARTTAPRQMITLRSSFVIALLATAVGFAPAVRSADQLTWRVDAPAQAVPQHFTVAPLGDGSAIILGPWHPETRHAWHLDADLQLHPQGVLSQNVSKLGEVDTAAGPLLVGEHHWGGKPCMRLAGAIAGRELRLAHSMQRDFVDELPFVDADGRFGLYGDYESPPEGDLNLRLLHSDHDCTPEWLFDAGDRHLYSVLNLSDGTGALALMRAEWESGEAERTRLVRMNRNGVVWNRRLQLADGNEVYPQTLTRLPDDDLLVGGSHYSAAEGSRTILQRLDAEGQLRWSHTIDKSGLPDEASIVQILVHDEAVLLTFRDGGIPPPLWPPPPPTALVAIGADGLELSRQPLEAPFSRLAQVPQRRHRPLYVSSDQLMETTAAGRLEVIGPRDGAMAEMAEGRFLRGATDPPRVWIEDEAGDPQTVEIPLPTTRPLHGNVMHGDHLGIADISSSVEEGWLFRVFDADGRLLWTWARAQAQAIAGPSVDLRGMHADETNICLMLTGGPELWLPCFERESGVLQGPIAHVSDIPFPWTLSFQVWKRDTGIWMLRFHEGQVLSRRLTGPDGPQPEQAVAGLTGYFPNPTFLPLDDRHLVVAGCGNECRTRVVDVDGELVLDLPLAWSSGDIEIHQAPNGFLLTSYVRSFNDPRRLEIERVDLASGLVWHRTMVMPTNLQNWSTPGEMLRRDDRWIHSLKTNPGLLITAFDDADGSSAWSQNRRLRGNRIGCLTPNLEGLLGLITQRGQRLDVDWLDPQDGSVVGASAFEDVGVIACPALPVGDTGTALSAVGVERREVLRIDPPAPSTEAPSIAWLRGVWYDPGSSGQGFMFQHYADQELMSGAWFTYTSDGEHDRADQRWYTLQAPTESSDSRAIGTIYSSESGRFGEPPAVSSQAVGSVELRMLSCDSALLSYRFDDPESHGQQGTMLLQRLVADAPECDEAPQSVASPSGSYWYDPATSGQGIYLQAIAGRAFGAWFTFDPDGSADDPTAQHWFTLAGDAPLPDGRLPARITRTIGGSLDDVATTNTAQVGDAWLRLIDCETAQLDYQFNEPRYAAAFEGLAGSVMLQRIGGCEALVPNH